MDTKVREPIFKVGDNVTYKSHEECDEYYWGGTDAKGFVGTIIDYSSFISGKDCYQIHVTHPEGQYTMLESEFVEYDEKVKNLTTLDSVKIVSFEDLVAGEIYVQANGTYIFKHKTGYAIKPSDERFFDGMWSDNDFRGEFSYVESATPQQKRWLEHCISKRCFVPIESVTPTKKVEDLAYPDVVHCTTKEQVDAINEVLGSEGIYEFVSSKFYYLLGRNGYSSSSYNDTSGRGKPYVNYEFEDIIFPEPIVNTYGLSVGDKLPEQIIRKWSEVGQNRLDAGEVEWKQQASSFCGDRIIKSFKKYQGIIGFEVSGTSKVYLRAEGFKEFMEKEMSEKNPINEGDYVVFLKKNLGGNGFKVGDILNVRTVEVTPRGGFSITYCGNGRINHWTTIKDGCKVFKTEIEAKQFAKQLLETTESKQPLDSEDKSLDLYFEVINSGSSYMTHTKAVSYGCTNYDRGNKLRNGQIAKAIRRIKINSYAWGYSLDYNGKHYLIGEGGLKPSTKEAYDAQFTTAKPSESKTFKYNETTRGGYYTETYGGKSYICLSGGGRSIRYCISSDGRFLEDVDFSDASRIVPSTPEEIQWLDACIKKGEFIDKSRALQQSVSTSSATREITTKFKLGDHVKAIDGDAEGYVGVIIAIDPNDNVQSYVVQFTDWVDGMNACDYDWDDLIGEIPDASEDDCCWCRASDLLLVDEVVEVKTTTSELKPGIYFKYNIGDRVKISSTSIIGTIVRLDYDYDTITDSSLCYLVHFPGFGQGVKWNHHISDKLIGKTFEGDTSNDYLWCSADDIEKISSLTKSVLIESDSDESVLSTVNFLLQK